MTIINFVDDFLPNALLVPNVSNVTMTYGKNEID